LNSYVDPTGPAITEELIGEIRARLALGMSRAPAYRASGVSPRTARYWTMQGRKHQEGEAVPHGGLYARFRDAVLEGESMFEEKAVRTILQAAGPQIHEHVNSRTGEIVQLQKPGDARPLLRLMANRMPEAHATESKLHSPMRLIQLLSDSGVEISEEQALKLVAGTDLPDTKRVDAQLKAGSKEGRKALTAVADSLRQLRQSVAPAPKVIEAKTEQDAAEVVDALTNGTPKAKAKAKTPKPDPDAPARQASLFDGMAG